MFDTVYYSRKSTKKEECVVYFEKVGNQVIRCVQKETEQLMVQRNDSDGPKNVEDHCLDKAFLHF